MRFKRLNKRVKTMWALNRLPFSAALIAAAVAVIVFTKSVWGIITALLLIITALAAAVGYPLVEYLQWMYYIGEDVIEIKKGIFFKNHSIIPTSRIHNVNVYRGPMLKLFGLSTLCINTAGGAFRIEGIEEKEAEEVAQSLKQIIKDGGAGVKGEMIENGEK